MYLGNFRWVMEIKGHMISVARIVFSNNSPFIYPHR